MAGFLAAAMAGAAAGQAQRNDLVVAVPPPGPVAVDGDLKDWDLTGAVDCAYDASLAPKFTLRFAAMYDAGALYLAAHVVDDTPLANRHDPKVEPNLGWAGDCLQVRLASDPRLGWPLRVSEYSAREGDAAARSDRICHLTLWHFTDRAEPVLQVQYGMDFHGTKVWTGTESASGSAFSSTVGGRSAAARRPLAAKRARPHTSAVWNAKPLERTTS